MNHFHQKSFEVPIKGLKLVCQRQAMVEIFANYVTYVLNKSQNFSAKFLRQIFLSSLYLFMYDQISNTVILCSRIYALFDSNYLYTIQKQAEDNGQFLIDFEINWPQFQKCCFQELEFRPIFPNLSIKYYSKVVWDSVANKILLIFRDIQNNSLLCSLLMIQLLIYAKCLFLIW